MLTAYFDASGSDHDQIALTVAGFISSPKDWSEFEKQWVARLNADNVTCLHMTEFARSKGEFAGWAEERRRLFLADLIEIIRKYTYQQFGCAVIIDPFKGELPEDLRDEFRFTAYSLAARTCVSNVTRWVKAQDWKTDVEYVFEDGDLHVGTMIDNFKRDGYPAPVFKPKRDRDGGPGGIIPGCVPLQAADFLAYELFLSVKHKESGRLDSHPLRWAMAEFLSRDGLDNLRTWQAHDLAELRALIDKQKNEQGAILFN